MKMVVVAFLWLYAGQTGAVEKDEPDRQHTICPYHVDEFLRERARVLRHLVGYGRLVPVIAHRAHIHVEPLAVRLVGRHRCAVSEADVAETDPRTAWISALPRCTDGLDGADGVGRPILPRWRRVIVVTGVGSRRRRIDGAAPGAGGR